jgi:hypothetical protein
MARRRERQAMTDVDLEQVAGGGGATIKIVVRTLTDDDLAEVVGGNVIITPLPFPNEE